MSLPAHRTLTVRGLSPGRRLGRHVVVRRLGSGGMAEVYLARLDGPQGFVKPVALKLMHTHLLDDPAFVELFGREARIAAKLDHPGIVGVLDIGEAQGEHYLALEYVHGRDLRQVLVDARNEPLPLGCVLRIVIDVADALAHAHGLHDAAGRPLDIVHRDVSPSNVLVSYAGVVKLADFGVARVVEQTQATQTASLKGKLGYMSPEQCLQEAIDRRSDVFSLGVVLYEATTGRRAFVGEPLAVLNAVIDGRFVPPEQARPDYPAGLAAIVRRSLAHEVDLRHPGADVLARELEAFAATAGLDVSREALARELARRYGAPALPDLTLHHSDEPPSMPEDDATLELSTLRRATVAPKRSRWVLGGVALAAALGLGLAGWAIVPREPVEPPPTIAPAASEDIAPASIAPQTAAVPVPVMITAPKPTSQPPRVAAPTARTPPRNRRTSRAKPVTSSQPSRPESKLDPRDAMLPRSAR